MTSAWPSEAEPHAEQQTFEVYGHTLADSGTPEAQRLLAATHADRIRPVCRCRPEGVAMYVAKVGPARFLVKRMPDSGPAHAHHCPSYLPPGALSGLGKVLGAAITADPANGATALRFGFRMSTSRQAAPTGEGRGVAAGSVAEAPSRLSLRALLHYLWHEAGLATWSPRMAGKRNWRVVSWHLRSAAQGKITGHRPLLDVLFVPEPFSADRKTQIAARRLAAWAPLEQPGAGRRSMLLIGELKAVERARIGHKLVIRHLPDAPLMLDDVLLARLNRRCGADLELWRSDEDGHLIVIATFSVGRGGLATVEEISLVMTDRHWLPYESPADKVLLDTAVAQRRRFIKCLRYNLAADAPMASLVFTDTAAPTAAFLLVADTDRDAVDELASATGTDTWTWVLGEPMPPLPPAADHGPTHRPTAK